MKFVLIFDNILICQNVIIVFFFFLKFHLKNIYFIENFYLQMLCLFHLLPVFTCSLNYSKYDLYLGNWSVYYADSGNSTVINKSAKFSLHVSKETQNISNYTVSSSHGNFRQFSQLNLVTRINTTFYCIHLPNNSLFMMSFINIIDPKAEDCINIIENIRNHYNYSEFNFTGIVDELENRVNEQMPDIEFLSFMINFSHSDIYINPFALSTRLNASLFKIIPSKNISLSFHGYKFDLDKYVLECKNFSILLCFYTLLNVYAWVSIFEFNKSEIHWKKLSLTSFVLHVCLEFGFDMFVLEKCFSVGGMKGAMLLFNILIFIYFNYHIHALTLIWKHNYIGDDATAVDIQRATLGFFALVSAFMVVSSRVVTSVFDRPLICLIYIYSTFLPQILFSIKHNTKNSNNAHFVVLTTLARLIPLGYFTLYEKNIEGVYGPILFVIFGTYSLIQMIIIILQNKYGGRFGLRSKNQYDYFASSYSDIECPICMTNIEIDQEQMTTPCGHTYHSGCLRRWLEEKLVCPVCRMNIPPLE